MKASAFCNCEIRCNIISMCGIFEINEVIFYLTSESKQHIIHLTGKPIDRCRLSTPAKNKVKE